MARSDPNFGTFHDALPFAREGHIQGRLELSIGHAGSSTCHEGDPPVIRLRRPIQLRLRRQRDVKIRDGSGPYATKVFWQDTHNREAERGKRDELTDHAGIEIKLLLPQAIRDDDARCGSSPLVLGAEQMAEGRTHAQSGEKVAGDQPSVCPDGFVPPP